MNEVLQNISNMERQQQSRKEREVGSGNAPHPRIVEDVLEVNSVIQPIPTYQFLSETVKPTPNLYSLNEGEDGFAALEHVSAAIYISGSAEDLPLRVDDVKPYVTQRQHDILEAHFQANSKPTTASKKGLAEGLGVSLSRINNWFQNRRAKAKQDLKKQMSQDVSQINSIISHHAPHIDPIDGSKISYPPTPDWSFLRTEHDFSSPSSVNPDCPSLSSSSTISSRNSSTRSSKSLRWHAAEWPQEEEGEEDSKLQRYRCPLPECNSLFKDLKDHMLTHQHEPHEKCPIETCEYHVKGFAKAYDRVRHTNTHFKGTLICGFCKDSEKSFDRQDVFSRHIISAHGAQEVTKKVRQELYEGRLVEAPKPYEGQPIAACTLCLELLDPQGFLDHLTSCVYRHVTKVTKDGQEKLPEPNQDADDNHGGPRNDYVVTEGGNVDFVESGSRETKCSTDLRESFRCTFCGKIFGSVDILRDHDEIHNQRGEDSLSTASAEIVSIAATKDGALGTTSSKAEAEAIGQPEAEGTCVEQLTASSRCLSLTSNEFRSSDEETDWTEDVSSPQSQPDAVNALSPLKRKLVDEIMKEFHRVFDRRLSSQRNDKRPQIQTCQGGSSSSCGFSGASSSSGSSSSGSPYVSRKRSLSGGGSPPPNGNKNNGDDPNKRRRPDITPQRKDSYLPERRFACPYYKRNPGRHQTFTSCRDPGFITVARLKEHLYRRHLLPIQCNRCCSTFPNEPSLREHQRDPRGCEVQKQIPLEGFDKDQERKLKSKKRSLAYQSEEDKWKCVYCILFPDDSEDAMPSPYIEYQVSGNTASGEPSNIARFQEFSRLELPRLVRRTLEVVVEEEAQPLEEKLKDRLVDIVKECQTQLISMFQGSEGTLDASNIPSILPDPTSEPQPSSVALDAPFQGFDSFNNVPLAESYPTSFEKAGQCDLADTRKFDASPPTGTTDSPDSGYDSAWTTTTLPQDAVFSEMPFYGESEYVDLGGYYELFENRSVTAEFDPWVWSFANSTAHTVSTNAFPEERGSSR